MKVTIRKGTVAYQFLVVMIARDRFCKAVMKELRLMELVEWLEARLSRWGKAAKDQTE